MCESGDLVETGPNISRNTSNDMVLEEYNGG